MTERDAPRPTITFEYTDPETGTRGALVIHRLVRGVAAGGLRIKPGLGTAELTALARNMTLKQAVAGLEVGGAKSGLDMDPASPARRDVLRRFLRAMKPLILDCYSVGPDVNTTMPELEGLAREVGIPSLKICVGRSRNIPDEEYLARYALFEAQVEGGTVNELRGAMAVFASARALFDELQAGPRPRVAIQGAGNMGGAAARLLHRAGARIVSWADDQKCLENDDGLDVPALLARRSGGRLEASAGARPSSAVLEARCDVLVLAAISRAFDTDHVGALRCRGIVEAANLALAHDVEDLLHGRGVRVIPDIIASVGGSLAVEALYAGAPRSGQDVLDHVARRADDNARAVLRASRELGVPPRAAAMARIDRALL